MRRIPLLIVLTLLFMVLPPVVQQTQAQDDTSVRYRVVERSALPNVWINEDFTEFTPYQIPEASAINVSGFDLSDPNSKLDLQIGNLSLIDIQDSDIEGNLILGYYEMPFYHGIIANTSWDVSIDLFQSFQFNQSRIIQEDKEYLGESEQVIIFQFAIFGQQTELTYSKSQGLLLEAVTGFGQYFLEFIIEDASLPDTRSPTTESLEIPVSIIPVLLALPGWSLLTRRLLKV